MRIAHPVGVTVPLRIRSVKDRGEGGYSWHVFMIHKVTGAMETSGPLNWQRCAEIASVERVPPGSLAPVRAGAFSCLPPAATAVEAATANEQDDQNDDQQGRGVHVALPRWRCAPRIVLAVFRPTLIRWCLFRRRRRLGRPTSYAVAGQHGGILARPRPRGRKRISRHGL